MAQPILTQQQREQLQALVEHFPTQDTLAARTVVFLRAACVDLEISHTGNKPELVARIWQVIQRANEMLALEEQQPPDDQQPPVTPPPLGGAAATRRAPTSRVSSAGTVPSCGTGRPVANGGPSGKSRGGSARTGSPSAPSATAKPLCAMQFMAYQQPPAQQQPFLSSSSRTSCRCSSSSNRPSISHFSHLLLHSRTW